MVDDLHVVAGSTSQEAGIASDSAPCCVVFVAELRMAEDTIVWTRYVSVGMGSSAAAKSTSVRPGLVDATTQHCEVACRLARLYQILGMDFAVLIVLVNALVMMAARVCQVAWVAGLLAFVMMLMGTP